MFFFIKIAFAKFTPAIDMSLITNKHIFSLQELMDRIIKKNPNQPEFHQAVLEVFESILPFAVKNKKYAKRTLLEIMSEPERTIGFRISWQNDEGNIEVNKGYRVQMSSSIGPYKGGLRFHPSVNLSILKFLAFEQIFKNSLTSLPLGAGKGGSDFDPKGKSDNEIRRFCQNFMTELYRHIGDSTDIPAGDIGVGAREIGYLFGQYKKITNQFNGVLTGKTYGWGGSLIRPEATGYGCVYFTQHLLKDRNEDLEGQKIGISGSGNVAQYAAEKAIELGGIVQTLSDSKGVVYAENGLKQEHIEFTKILKNEKRGRIKELADHFDGIKYFESEKPWRFPLSIALPCATQNELNLGEVNSLVSNGLKYVVEGANMPTTPDAISFLHANNVAYGPGKASNAGGVATSGLEMSQNALKLHWSSQEVDQKLQGIMTNIHAQCKEFGSESGSINYAKGANIAGFVRVADAMLDQGLA